MSPWFCNRSLLFASHVVLNKGSEKIAAGGLKTPCRGMFPSVRRSAKMHSPKACGKLRIYGRDAKASNLWRSQVQLHELAQSVASTEAHIKMIVEDVSFRRRPPLQFWSSARTIIFLL
jgi:hypothetical protein